MAKRVIKIEIDCNNDSINLYENNKLVCTTNVEYPNKYIKLFSELFNRLINEERDINYISITKVDEDSDTTIEEW